MLRVKFQVNLSGTPSRLLKSDESIESIEVDNEFYVDGDYEFLFLTLRSDRELSSERLSAELSDIDIVYMTPAAVSHTTYYLGTITARADQSVLSVLTENRAIPHRITGQNAHFKIVASVSNWQHLKEVAGAIEAAHGPLELVGTTQTEQIGYPLGSDKLRQTLSGKLSDQQLSVLEAAYQMGLFKVPQEATAGEIADELEISRSTLSERLHRVQHSLCELLFGP
jgi:predicted DNA binding protein